MLPSLPVYNFGDRFSSDTKHIRKLSMVDAGICKTPDSDYILGCNLRGAGVFPAGDLIKLVLQGMVAVFLTIHPFKIGNMIVRFDPILVVDLIFSWGGGNKSFRYQSVHIPKMRLPVLKEVASMVTSTIHLNRSWRRPAERWLSCFAFYKSVAGADFPKIRNLIESFKAKYRTPNFHFYNPLLKMEL